MSNNNLFYYDYGPKYLSQPSSIIFMKLLNPLFRRLSFELPLINFSDIASFKNIDILRLTKRKFYKHNLHKKCIYL